MKKLILPLLFTVLVAMNSNHGIAQCEPDVINCIDTASPGQICPMILPDGIIDQAYEQVVTIIPPYEADLGTGNIIEIVKIVIDSINNLPPGLAWEANAEEFYADSVYCVLLSEIGRASGRESV